MIPTRSPASTPLSASSDATRALASSSSLYETSKSSSLIAVLSGCCSAVSVRTLTRFMPKTPLPGWTALSLPGHGMSSNRQHSATQNAGFRLDPALSGRSGRVLLCGASARLGRLDLAVLRGCGGHELAEQARRHRGDVVDRSL